ncbi:MAG: hypothetical protein FWG24_05200, partial [Eggerthellaceae bacterium]|nr:hypothetical protein [Eggerthellaceae bacterium]
MMRTLKKSGAFVFALVVVLVVALSLPLWAIATEPAETSLLEVEDVASPEEAAEADDVESAVDEADAGEIAVTPLANPESDFEYQVTNGNYGYGAYITGLTDDSLKNVVVPETLNGGDVVSISFFNQGLETLDVSACAALYSLVCYWNQLTALDVSKNIKLENLDCSYNQLTALDVSKNTSLWQMTCSSNRLTALNVSKNTSLWQMTCSYNQLTTLDVSKNTNLVNLNCSENQLATLDVSKNGSLTSLGCSYNNLAILDISKNTYLTNLDCSHNDLTTLDISQNTNLDTLGCHKNFIADTSALETWLESNDGQVLPQKTSELSAEIQFMPWMIGSGGYWGRLCFDADQTDGILVGAQSIRFVLEGYPEYIDPDDNRLSVQLNRMLNPGTNEWGNPDYSIDFDLIQDGTTYTMVVDLTKYAAQITSNTELWIGYHWVAPFYGEVTASLYIDDALMDEVTVKNDPPVITYDCAGETRYTKGSGLDFSASIAWQPYGYMEYTPGYGTVFGTPEYIEAFGYTYIKDYWEDYAPEGTYWLIDGTLYTEPVDATRGSVVVSASGEPQITLNASWLETLDEGDYTLRVHYGDDGMERTWVDITITIDPEPVMPPAASTKDITSFALAGATGTISGTNISVEVPYGTDLSSLVPTIAHNGMDLLPATSVAQDFSAPIQYVVIAEDGTTKTYTVTATVSRQILEGNFGTWTGAGTRSTTIEVPLEKFVDLYFGTEKLVLDSDYSVAEGSTIITLNESF